MDLKQWLKDKMFSPSKELMRTKRNPNRLPKAKKRYVRIYLRKKKSHKVKVPNQVPSIRISMSG